MTVNHLHQNGLGKSSKLPNVTHIPIVHVTSTLANQTNHTPNDLLPKFKLLRQNYKPFKLVNKRLRHAGLSCMLNSRWRMRQRRLLSMRMWSRHWPTFRRMAQRAFLFLQLMQLVKRRMEAMLWRARALEHQRWSVDLVESSWMFHAHTVSMGSDGCMQGKLKPSDVQAVLDAMEKISYMGVSKNSLHLRARKGEWHVYSSESQSTHCTTDILSNSVKKMKPTIANGLHTEWKDGKFLALRFQNVRLEANNNLNETLGRLQDVNVEDDPPASYSNHDHDNSVSPYVLSCIFCSWVLIWHNLDDHGDSK